MSKNNPNSLQNKTWLKVFDSFLTTLKAIVFLIFGTLLYGIFGHHFDFNFKKNDVAQKSTRTYNSTAIEEDWDKVENGIHLQTGLVHDASFDIVRANCTACHSGKLIAQNRATREGWLQMIRWMQETQGLWELGVNEPKILDYLAEHYAPEETGRRANIDMAAVEWYILEMEED